MRAKNIDRFRGFIMLIMAIDHISYFVLNVHFYEGFDRISRHETLLPFFTRFITHICAPGFFFCLGYGAYHQFMKKQTFSFILFKRGMLLILLQLTIINYIWDLEVVYFGVIFCLGIVLILLNFTMPLYRYAPYIGLSAIFLTQTLVGMDSDHLLIRLFIKPGMLYDAYLLYVILPWFGVAMLGVFVASRDDFNYYKAGVISIVLFILLRSLNTFGNTHLHQDTWISFLNVTKYPPSLVFLLLTLGINMILMGIFQRNIPILSTFGEAALVYYIGHLALYRILSEYFHSTSYAVLYFIWIISLVPLYYLCKVFNKKNARKLIFSRRNRLH